MSTDAADEMEKWSPYVSNKDNPILNKDPKGDCPQCIIGALIGAAVDVTMQVAENAATGKDLSNIKWGEVGIAAVAVAGAVSGGISAIYESVAAAGTTTLLSQSTAQVLNTASASVGVQLRQVDRTARIAANDLSSGGRAANALRALNRAKRFNFELPTASSSLLFGLGGTVFDLGKEHPTLTVDNAVPYAPGQSGSASASLTGGSTGSISVQDASAVKINAPQF